MLSRDLQDILICTSLPGYSGPHCESKISIRHCQPHQSPRNIYCFKDPYHFAVLSPHSSHSAQWQSYQYKAIIQYNYGSVVVINGTCDQALSHVWSNKKLKLLRKLKPWRSKTRAVKRQRRPWSHARCAYPPVYLCQFSNIFANESNISNKTLGLNKRFLQWDYWVWALVKNNVKNVEKSMDNFTK